MNLPKVVGCLGAGLMGTGIAQVICTAGIQTVLVDSSTSQLEKSKDSIRGSLQRLISKGKVTEDIDSVLSRLSISTELSSLRNVDFVIEAVPENETLKKDVFTQLDKVCSAFFVCTVVATIITSQRRACLLKHESALSADCASTCSSSQQHQFYFNNKDSFCNQ